MLMISFCKILIKIYISLLPLSTNSTILREPKTCDYTMKVRQTTTVRHDAPITEDAVKLADFVIFTQRSCILNLSPQLTGKRVSYPQFFLLTYLDNEDFLTMSSIAKKMGHSTAAATGMVDKLEEMGYIARTQAANDRRKIMVQITSDGKELVARMRQNIAHDLASIMQKQDADTIRHLTPTQKVIRKRINPSF